MSVRKSKRRRRLALVFAPLAVVPFIFLARVGYLQVPEHWDKFWLDDLLYLVIVSYLGSAIAAPAVMLLIRLRRDRPSIRCVCGWFTLVFIQHLRAHRLRRPKPARLPRRLSRRRWSSPCCTLSSRRLAPAPSRSPLA